MAMNLVGIYIVYGMNGTTSSATRPPVTVS
jgi:hypothetical protein